MSQEIFREANIKLQKIYKQRQAQEKQESYKDSFQKKIDKVEDIISKRLYNYSNVNNFIDEKSLSKTINLMSMIAEGNLKNSSFSNKDTTDSETQTGSTLLKEYEEMNKNLEKENETIKKEKLDLLSNNEILKEKIKMLNKEIEEKNSIIVKNNDEIREVRKSLDKLNKDNLNCRQQIDELVQKNNTFQKINSEYEKLKSLVKENYLFTGRQSVTRTSNVYDRRLSMDNTQQSGINYKFTNEPVLVRFFKLQLMKYIVRYLNVEDIANMKLVNTVFFDSIDSDIVLSNNFFMKVIKKKNDRILELTVEKKESEQNISESYVVSNEYIESLINK